MIAANMVANVRVGRVMFNHVSTGQVMLDNVKGFPLDKEMHCDVYNGCFPKIGDRIAINYVGLWMHEEDFDEVIEAVSEAVSILTDNLKLVGDTARQVVNLVVRRQMEAAHEARESQD